MKLTIPAAGLKRALSAVKGAAAVRSSAAILSTILFEAEEGKLTLSATDGESAARLSAPVSIEEEGKAAIPARTLTELVNHRSFFDTRRGYVRSVGAVEVLEEVSI